MRASRLLSVLLLLQTRGRLTAREMAAELEVSVRTVYRDLDALAEAGVPVLAERGATGGYELLAGYRTRLTGLTSDEADSLLFAGLPDAAAELGFGAVVAAAELKLLAALPAEARERALRVRELFHLDAPGWFRAAEPVPLLAEVAGAVWGRRRIRITYLRWRAPRRVVRELELLGVVLKSGTWYVVATACPGDGRADIADAPPAETPETPETPETAETAEASVRVYRVARILGLEAMPETFERPERFDLAAYWEQWTARYEAGVYRGTATVRLSPEGRRMVPFRLAPAVARAVEQTAGDPDADGWVRAELPIESVRHARGDLLVLGPELEVLDPPELRAAMADAVAGLTAFYGPPANPPAC
ncbi:WYL domain-containing protein [Frankia sp. Hr75.2]|nr:WYL domain-containing protein [Frankia sp. Hr75.2]